MKSEFTPYEQALALKELGFNESCFGKFLTPETPANRFRYNTEGSPKNYNNGSYGRFISAPLYQQAFSWLYKKLDMVGTIPLDNESQILLLKELIDKMSSKYLLV